MKSLILTLLALKLSVCQMDKNEPPPSWATTSSFYSVTKTDDELSVVCPSVVVPEGVKAEKGWIVYKVEGPLDFGMTGVLASVADPLASAKISIFAISTYDTDYILVKEENRESSLAALKKAGITVELQ